MGSAFYPAAGWNNGPAGLDLAAEVGRIEFTVEDDFIDLAQFGERKVFRQELKRDIGVADLVAQPPESVPKNLVVIERELFR